MNWFDHSIDAEKTDVRRTETLLVRRMLAGARRAGCKAFGAGNASLT